MEEIRVRVKKNSDVLEPAEDLIGLKTLLQGLSNDEKYNIVKQLVNYKLALIIKPLTDKLGPFNNYNTTTKINDRVVKVAFSICKSLASDRIKLSAMINVISNELNIISTEMKELNFIEDNKKSIKDYAETIINMINGF